MVTPNQKAPELAKRIGVASLVLKREDLHPLGSHKGRSIPAMIEHYATEGATSFAISSSGNAALAAVRYITIRPKIKPGAAQLSLTVYVGKNINKKKLDALTRETAGNAHIELRQVERPLQTLIASSKEGMIPLRQSTDNVALQGYESLAQELTNITDLQAVFIGSSSGTTAEALGNYLVEYGMPAEIHIVQTPDCHPLFTAVATKTSTVFSPVDQEQPSIADAIVDPVGHRKEHVARAVLETAGSASIVSNDEILEAQRIVKEAVGLDISTNSALSVAGLIQQKKAGRTWNGTLVCMICGL